MIPTILGGLALWFVAGCIVVVVLCLLFKAADHSRLSLNDHPEQDGAQVTGAGGGADFAHFGDVSK